MCVSDWRIGRLLRSQATAFHLTIGATHDILPNQQRVAIHIAGEDDAHAVPTFLRLLVNDVLLAIRYDILSEAYYSIKDYGDLVTGKWTISPPAGGSYITVVEWFLPEGVLAVSVDEFIRGH